jgi:cytochrome c553
MAKTISDEDVENLAEYYSGLCACKEPAIRDAAGDSETESP